jgi:cobalt/nickel transport system permease protein
VGRKSNNFIERSIMGALSFLKESIFADQYAGEKGLLQSLDSRVKTITILMLLVETMLCRNIFILLALYVFCLFLTYCSRVHLGYFLKRTWVFIPIFSLFIALPALFNAFTPGEPVFSFKLFGAPLIITRQGVLGSGSFVTRVITSVSLAVLLSVTTRHFQLLKVLRVFGVPQVFVMILGMCYRYLYLFVGIIEDTYLAIKSRVGNGMYYKSGQQLVAWNIAFLWQRSYQLNEDVYKAMLSRGYQGEPRELDDPRARAGDFIWLAAMIIICAGLLCLDFKLKR